MSTILAKYKRYLSDYNYKIIEDEDNTRREKTNVWLQLWGKTFFLMPNDDIIV